MTGHISIIIIILLTIKTIIISLKAIPTEANNKMGNISVGNELYRDLTAIEFLKELQLHNQTTFDNILIMQNQNATIANIFYKNFKDTTMEHHISNDYGQGLGVLSEMAATTSFVRELMATIQVPVLQLNELQSFYLKRHYCEHFLSIVYIDINIEGIQMTLNDHQGLLQKLSQNLLHMTTSKVMFLLNFPRDITSNGNAGATTADVYNASVALDEDVKRGVVLQLFQHCWQQKIINVVALLADYQVNVCMCLLFSREGIQKLILYKKIICETFRKHLH